MNEDDRVRHISWYNPEAFYKLLPENITEEVCNAAVDAGIPLGKIPEEFRTSRVCWSAINRSPYQLGNVPHKLLTESMILSAMLQMENPGISTVWNLPNQFITQRMVDLVWRRGQLSSLTSRNLYNNDHILKKCLKYVGTLLSQMREPTAKDCWIACNQTGRALEYVPKEFQTPRLCMSALSNGGRLSHVKIPLEEMQDYLMRVTGAPERVYDCMSTVLKMI